MNPKSIFGIGVRLFALWAAIWGLWNIAAGIVYFPCLFAHSTYDQNDMIGRIWRYLGYGSLAAAFGIILLRFANFVEDFAYPTKKSTPPPLPK
jgi:hypothetical protein